MKNPAHYPLARRQGVLRRRRRRRRAGRPASRPPATPSRRSTSTTSRSPAVIDLEDALSDRVVIHDDLGTNTSYTWALKVEGTEGAGRRRRSPTPRYTVSERYVQQRLHPDGDGAAGRRRRAAAVRRRHHALLGDADPAHPQDHDGDHARHPRAPGARRRPGGRRRLRLEAQRVRRGAARAWRWPASTACPVRWNEEPHRRTPLATIHGRGQIQHIELAADADGKLTAVRVRLLADMGAYLQLVTPGIPLLGAFLYAGVYDLPAAYDFECTSVFTTMTPTDAYRGAGRPEATYAIERAMDALAAQGRRRPARAAPAQLHRQAEAFPYTAWSGLVYDSRRPRRRGDRGRRARRLRRRCAPARRTQNVDGRHEAPRHRRVVVLRDVRPRPVAGARLAELLGRRLGGGDGAGAADRQGAGRHRHGAARPGPRDGVVDDRRRQARHQPRRRRRAAQRHGDRPARPRHLRLALAAGRRRRHRHGVRQGDRQGHADRRPPAGGERRRPRVRRRRVHA